MAMYTLLVVAGLAVGLARAAPMVGLDVPIPEYLPISIFAANPPRALPQRATANDLRWQPSLDFDTTGCYNVPAVDADGNIVQGLPHSWTGLSSDCRDASDLSNNNVYSRQRCNDNGWCIYLYDYYFEKDVAIPYFIDPGHTHDWEHVAVWVLNGVAQYVRVSQHGKYVIRSASEVRWEGEHPKIVYIKDGLTTHCFRFGNAEDERIKNHTGKWFRGPLISYNGFPGNVRNTLFNHDFGKATIAIKDETFQENIQKALPNGVTFDSGRDYGSPGIP